MRALSLAVVVTIALGAGALIATFAIVNAALFREPPFADANRLTMLYTVRRPQTEPVREERWSFSRIQLLQQSQRSFEQLASYSPTMITLAGDEEAEPVRGEFVSPSYFPLLRVAALRGRVFDASEDDVARPAATVLIGHALWTRRWAGRESIVGQTIRVNGVPLTVIGVLPEAFHGLSGRAELWIPRTMAPHLTYAEYVTTNQNFISVVGRLQRNVALSAARSELALLGATINHELPSDPDDPGERVTATAVPLNRARTEPTVRRSLLILFSAVALLHLLACANVTNLLLGRAAHKRRESALRIALGSSAGRLFMHILREGMALVAVGAVLGIALAWWLTTVTVPPANVWAPRNFYGSLAPFDVPAFGVRELAFGAALAAVTALVVALPPALSAFRIDVSSGIKGGSRGISGGALTLRRPSARAVIVGVETALAMLLAVAAGLLIDSFQRMRQTSVGVDPRQVLTFWVIPSEARVPPATAPVFVSRLLEAMSRVPGVLSASVDGGAPLSGTARSVLFIEGRSVPAIDRAPPVLRHYVGPDHFRTLSIPVRRGRVFTAADVAGAPRVTVISATAARRFWPAADPLGKRVWFGGGSSFDSPDRSAEIIGIVDDVVYEPLDQQPNFASFYTPYAQFTYASRMVFLRTLGNPLSVVSDVRKAIRTVDPDLAIRDVQPLAEIINGSWARHRFDAILFGGFGIIALLLAATGIFAVLAHAVTSRTREFGIRIALGADRPRVLRLVLREGMTFPALGLIAGIVASIAATRLLRSTLYEVSPLEPRVFGATTVLLLAVAAAACLGPAWRATRADPMEALRAE
jgi:predicted permease